MTDAFIPLHLDRIMQAHNMTAFVLKSEHERFAIYTLPEVGKMLEGALAGERPKRPSTHHLMRSVLAGLRAKLLQVVIWDVHDTIYTARLFLEQKHDESTQILEIDARPSDCLALALLHRIPILARQEVIEKVVPIED